MKNYKIQIEDSEVQFFKQLMDKLGFVRYEEVDIVSEPRIYPATNFTIHAKKTPPEKKMDITAREENTRITKEPIKARKDAMTDIRDIMSKIEQMRNRPK